MPIKKIFAWLDKEKQLGSPEPDRVVLATALANGTVHSRIVAIREITEEGVLFFTQKTSRKVVDLSENPSASMTLWLPLQQREIVFDGFAKALTADENQKYWNTLPYERQVRFSLYQSGRAISSLKELDNEYQILLTKYRDEKVPMWDSYCGYRLCPEIIYFYTLGLEKFSEVMKYSRTESGWSEQLVSP
jgi:pyridoxamine 5'-phosphate oxidase